MFVSFPAAGNPPARHVYRTLSRADMKHRRHGGYAQEERLTVLAVSNHVLRAVPAAYRYHSGPPVYRGG